MTPAKMQQGLRRRTEMNREKWRWRAKSRPTQRLSPRPTPTWPPQLATLVQFERIDIPHLQPVLRPPTRRMTTASGFHSRRCSSARFLLQRVNPPPYPPTIVTARLTACSPTSRTTSRNPDRVRAHHHSTGNKQKTSPMPYQQTPSGVFLPWFSHLCLGKAYQHVGTT